MNRITQSFPPVVVTAEDCERLLPLETELCEAAGSLLSQGLACLELNDALNLLLMTNELLWAHEGASLADECLHLCAEQIKCHQLAQIEKLLAVP